MMIGATMISAERVRQVQQEGFTAQHDATNPNGELIQAAAAYALLALHQQHEPVPASGGRAEVAPPPMWPWATEWWKPAPDAVRNLVKAGALLAAEIDRLKRLESQCDAGPG